MFHSNDIYIVNLPIFMLLKIGLKIFLLKYLIMH